MSRYWPQPSLNTWTPRVRIKVSQFKIKVHGIPLGKLCRAQQTATCQLTHKIVRKAFPANNLDVLIYTLGVLIYYVKKEARNLQS